MESINKELADKLYDKIDDCMWLKESQLKLIEILIEEFFDDDSPPLYYEKVGCKPCWRCHGTGTNEGMA